jgi:hypothetical protein
MTGSGNTNFGGEERSKKEIRQFRRTMRECGLLKPKDETAVWTIKLGGREYLRTCPNSQAQAVRGRVGYVQVGARKPIGSDMGDWTDGAAIMIPAGGTARPFLPS